MIIWLVVIGMSMALIIWISTRIHTRPIKEWSKNLAQTQLNALEQYGANIREHQEHIKTGSIRLSKQSYTQLSERVVNIPTNTAQTSRSEQAIDPRLFPLRDRVLNIMIGRYQLDLGANEYLKSRIGIVLQYLLDRKGSRTDAVEVIEAEYDPSVSDDLLLEACRDLMEYVSIPPSTRILVAQYIVNKTRDGDELDHVYNWIVSVALNPEMSHNVRAEAADMLTLSNSNRYMKIARDALEQLRRVEDVPLDLPEPTEIRPRNIPVPQRPRQVGREQRGWLAGVELPTAIVGRADPFAGINIDQQRRLLAQYEAKQPTVERTIHQDGQSVHNSEINSSVLEAAAALIKQYRPNGGLIRFDQTRLNDLPVYQRDKVNKALHRIDTDTSTFKHGTTLSTLMQSLQNFIGKNSNKEELTKRLIDELIDMADTCATGHLSRLVNVVQGFEGAPEQKIKISLKDEIYAKASHALAMAFKKPENTTAAEAMAMGDDPQTINRFVASELTKLIPELEAEYKDVAKQKDITLELVAAAKTYTKTNSFGLVDGQIVAKG